MAIRHLTEHTDTMHLWIFKALCASTATIPLRVRLAAAETSSNCKGILVQQKAEKKLAWNRLRTRIFQRRTFRHYQADIKLSFLLPCTVSKMSNSMQVIWAIQLAWLRHDAVGPRIEYTTKRLGCSTWCNHMQPNRSYLQPVFWL